MTQFRGLDCVEFEESGRSYLRVDTSVWCDDESEEHKRLLDVVVPFVVLYQSIPFVWAYLLITNRSRLNPAYRNDLASRRRRDRDEVLAPLSFLFTAYRSDRWYFDVLDMWRRIVMVGLLPFGPVLLRPIIGSGLAALSIVVFVEAQPYHDAATVSWVGFGGRDGRP